MKTGAELIAAERTRQIEQEGWSRERDVAVHQNDELALAAATYAMPNRLRERFSDRIGGWIAIWWPWPVKWWKPTPEDRVRELVKAGALIAAEIDRLQAIKVGAE